MKLRKPPNLRRPNLEEIAIIIERYNKGEALQILSKAFNFSYDKLRRVLKDEGVHLRGRKEASACRNHSNDREPEYIPSPEEIAEQTAMIRKVHKAKRRLETRHEYEQTPSSIRECSAAPKGQL